jgi:uncharacterized protein (TIGR02231 family)
MGIMNLKGSADEMEVAVDEGPAAGEPGPPSPAEDLLDYSRLRMAGLKHPRRGKLEITEAVENKEVPAGALSALSRAVIRAAGAPDLPERFVRPDSPDGFDYAYVCATPVDVPSKKKYTGIPVCRQPVDIHIRYVAVPREAPEVFRVARIRNPLQSPLLPGPVDLYLDGDFFITAAMKVVAPLGKEDLGLGVEQAVKVARNTFFEEESSGALKGKLVLKHDIEIEVINNLSRDIDLEVRERVPVKRDGDEDVEIALRDAKPPWEEYDKPPEHIRGRYHWQVRLAAGEKRSLRAGYDVRISARQEIVGGNRREA